MTEWKRALEMEIEVSRIINQQQVNGVEFDIAKAHKHITDIKHKKQELYSEMRPYLSMEVVHRFQTEVKKPWIANGNWSNAVVKWYEDKIPDITGPFSRVEFVEPDIGSRQKLTKQLLKVGWKPDLYTDKGSPKLTDKGSPVPSLMKIEAPVGKSLAEWYVLSHRQGQIQGWIDRVRPDGRLTSGANSCGTNTARMRHRIVVNVPKAAPEVIYGYEMRDLFITRNGYSMCGHDASGLEARIMGHYTFPIDGGEFAELILHGDIHSKNAKAFFPAELDGHVIGDVVFKYYRNMAKTLFYALIYGAQVGKVKSIVGCSQKRAQAIFNAFWAINPGLGRLRDKVIKLAEKNGWIPGLDGRKIYIRSSHSALNALFQSGGAIVMKASLVILDHWVRKAELDVMKVIDMHDEAQAEVNNDDIITARGTLEEVERATDVGIWTPIHDNEGVFEAMHCMYGELAVKSIRKAGEVYGLRCDLDAEYMIGSSWAKTH